MCVYTILCNLPPTIMKMVEFEGELTLLRTLTMLIYWSQFSGNFVIYAATNKQYREAYLLVVNDFLEVFKRCCCKETSIEDSSM